MAQDLDPLTQLAFDEAPTGLVLTENRIIRICNRRFAELLGYRVEELSDQSFRLLYGSDEEFDSIRDVGLTTMRQSGGYKHVTYLTNTCPHCSGRFVVKEALAALLVRDMQQ